MGYELKRGREFDFTCVAERTAIKLENESKIGTDILSILEP